MFTGLEGVRGSVVRNPIQSPEIPGHTAVGDSNPCAPPGAPPRGPVVVPDIPCELVSWERFYRLARQLARTLHNAGYYPDTIVAIARGGYIPARILSDYLGVFDLAHIKIEHYRGARSERSARIRYPLNADICGRRVLLVDDVSDSGDTFDVALRHLREHGSAAELRTAVLHHKRVSTFVPDYFAQEVVDWRWIIYPWAIMEDLTGFLRDMVPPPDSVDAFAEFLLDRHGISVERGTLEDVLKFTAGRGA